MDLNEDNEPVPADTDLPEIKSTCNDSGKDDHCGGACDYN